MKEAGDKIKEVGDKTTEVGKGLSTHVTAPIVAIGMEDECIESNA